MKRIASFVIVAILIGNVFVGMIGNNAWRMEAKGEESGGKTGDNSVKNLPFFDSFEDVPDGEYPDEHGWHMLWSGAETPYVTTGDAYDGNKYIVLNGAGGWVRSDGINLDLTGVTSLYYEFAVKIPSGSSSGAWVGFFVRTSSSTSISYNSVRFNNDNHIYVRGNKESMDTGIVWHYDKWYHVKVFIDYQNLKMNTWIDNDLVSTGITPAKAGISNIFSIATTNYYYGDNGIVYYDFIKIYATTTQPHTISVNYPSDKTVSMIVDKGDGRFKMIINNWNLKGSSSKGEQTMSYTAGNVEFHSKLARVAFKDPSQQIAGYPEILYGNSPWSPEVTVNDEDVSLPMKINTLKSNRFVVNADYSLNLPNDLSLDLAMETWITKNSNKGLSNGDLELMIWLYNTNLPPYGTLVDTYYIPIKLDEDLINTAFKVYVAQRNDKSDDSHSLNWNLVSFVMVNQALKNRIAIDPYVFVSFAIDALEKHYQKPFDYSNYYLRTWEIGTEYSKRKMDDSADFSWSIKRYDLESGSIGEPGRILPVPFERDPANNWCFPTALSSIMRYYGANVHPWDIAKYKNLPSGTGTGSWEDVGGLLSWVDDYLKEYGITYRATKNKISFEAIRHQIDKGKPILYASNSHAWVIVGYTEELGKKYIYNYDAEYTPYEILGNGMIEVISWKEFESLMNKYHYYYMYDFQSSNDIKVGGTTASILLSDTSLRVYDPKDNENFYGLYLDRGLKWAYYYVENHLQKQKMINYGPLPSDSLISSPSLAVSNTDKKDLQLKIFVKIIDSRGRDILTKKSKEIYLEAMSKKYFDIKELGLYTPSTPGIYKLLIILYDETHEAVADSIYPIIFTIGDNYKDLEEIDINCPVSVEMLYNKNNTVKILNGTIRGNISNGLIFTDNHINEILLMPSNYTFTVTGIKKGHYTIIVKRYGPAYEKAFSLLNVYTENNINDSFNISSDLSTINIFSGAKNRTSKLEIYNQTGINYFNEGNSSGIKNSENLFCIDKFPMANYVYTFKIRNWKNLTHAKILLYADKNNDGRVDKKLLLENQMTPNTIKKEINKKRGIPGFELIAFVVAVAVALMRKRRR